MNEEAFLGLLAGFFSGFSDVPVHDDPPIFSVDGISVFSGGFLGEAPLERERTHASSGHRSDRKYSGSVFSSESHSGGADH